MGHYFIRKICRKIVPLSLRLKRLDGKVISKDLDRKLKQLIPETYRGEVASRTSLREHYFDSKKLYFRFKDIILPSEGFYEKCVGDYDLYDVFVKWRLFLRLSQFLKFISF